MAYPKSVLVIVEEGIRSSTLPVERTMPTSGTLGPRTLCNPLNPPAQPTPPLKLILVTWGVLPTMVFAISCRTKYVSTPLVWSNSITVNCESFWLLLLTCSCSNFANRERCIPQLSQNLLLKKKFKKKSTRAHFQSSNRVVTLAYLLDAQWSNQSQPASIGTKRENCKTSLSFQISSQCFTNPRRYPNHYIYSFSDHTRTRTRSRNVTKIICEVIVNEENPQKRVLGQKNLKILVHDHERSAFQIGESIYRGHLVSSIKRGKSRRFRARASRGNSSFLLSYCLAFHAWSNDLLRSVWGDAIGVWTIRRCDSAGNRTLLATTIISKTKV